ncbi:alpha/beta hydrolase [Parasphingorhabdus flavimaris]|uniref:Alpha/beta hydrolase n=1 Tax=Parasphingorhabdus flavimaris TaxID=266812 RepID=A0ABX2N0S1_9SPHN|nr:alpha/beta hydrolase [Parasphingorhabdus flavimaris]NVD27315.1 alpha/beta hydrolase [Parasphingorhabdus flavimaris]
MTGNQPTEHRFSSTRGDICYFEWGRAGDAQSVLLLHATGFHARCWDQVVGAFPDGTHVVVVDQLGHGRSASPPISDWGMIAGATAELVESLDTRFTVGAGHSMGGNCLVQVVARQPDLFERLVLIDPVIMERAAYESSADFSATYEMVAKRRNSWAGPDEMIERFKDRHPYKLWDPAVLRDYCEYGLLPDGEGGFELACPPATEASIYASSTSIDPWPMIDGIDQPVTILRAPQIKQDGIFDFASSPTPPGLADSFARGSDHYLPDLTHFMPMQDPERIAGLILAG